jgi:hypothetical protein
MLHYVVTSPPKNDDGLPKQFPAANCLTAKSSLMNNQAAGRPEEMKSKVMMRSAKYKENPNAVVRSE